MSDDRIRALERLALGGDALALERLKAEWGRIQPPKTPLMTFSLNAGRAAVSWGYPGTIISGAGLRVDDIMISHMTFVNLSNRPRILKVLTDDKMLVIVPDEPQQACPTCVATGNSDYNEHVAHLEAERDDLDDKTPGHTSYE